MKKPLVSEMTLRSKINQLVVFTQWDLTRKYEEKDYSLKRPEEDQKEMLIKNQYGIFQAQYGDIIKDRNTDLLDSVTDQRCSSAEFAAMANWEASFLKIPPLFGGDSEAMGAGQVHHDLTSVISPLAMGATDDENLVYELGAAIGREFRCTGLNWRWSPVLDITNRFSYLCTATRVFSDMDVEKQSRLGCAMIKGMQSEGVAATAKHFPGHDPYAYRDGHVTQSGGMTISKEEWWEKQGVIFQNAIDAGVYSIMTSHIPFPAIDDSTIDGMYRPATISKKITTDLLKNEMGFEGVVLTDGITMGSISSILPFEELVVEIVNAGNDVILSAPPETMDVMEKAVLDGRIPESRIDDACQRVLDMKEKLGLFEDDYVNVKYKAEDVRGKTEALTLEAARKAATLVRDRNNILPLDKKKIKKVSIIVSTHHDSFYDTTIPCLVKEFEDRGIEVYVQRRINDAYELETISENSDLIIYATMVNGHMPRGIATLYAEEILTYWHAFKYGREKSIGISCGSPYIGDDILGNADVFVNLYCMSPFMIKAFVEGIFGEIPFTAKSPVNLKPPKFVYED